MAAASASPLDAALDAALSRRPSVADSSAGAAAAKNALAFGRLSPWATSSSSSSCRWASLRALPLCRCPRRRPLPSSSAACLRPLSWRRASLAAAALRLRRRRSALLVLLELELLSLLLPLLLLQSLSLSLSSWCPDERDRPTEALLASLPQNILLPTVALRLFLVVQVCPATLVVLRIARAGHVVARPALECLKPSALLIRRVGSALRREGALALAAVFNLTPELVSPLVSHRKEAPRASFRWTP